MIVTIVWEDQSNCRGFAPHALVKKLLEDRDLVDAAKQVEYIDAKGNGKVRKKLQTDGQRLRNSGPVFAVLDLDRLHELLRMPSGTCKTRLRERFLRDVPELPDLEIIFLDQNMESLVTACSQALNLPPLDRKPTLQERDDIINRAAWSSIETRKRVLESCPSIARLTDKLEARLA